MRTDWRYQGDRIHLALPEQGISCTITNRLKQQIFFVRIMMEASGSIVEISVMSPWMGLSMS